MNALPDPTVVHWHGLLVPEEADGHPRNVIGPGASYAYEFPIVHRAGTYWYHPHAHHRTAEQIHRGLAGFFIVVNGFHSYSTAPCPASTPCYDLSSPAVRPDIPATPTWADYRDGRDPAMEAILPATRKTR